MPKTLKLDENAIEKTMLRIISSIHAKKIETQTFRMGAPGRLNPI